MGLYAFITHLYAKVVMCKPDICPCNYLLIQSVKRSPDWMVIQRAHLYLHGLKIS